MSDELDVVATPRAHRPDREPALEIHTGVHPEVEGVVHVVRRKAVLALSLGLYVLAACVCLETEHRLVKNSIASWVVHVIGPDCVGDDRQHLPVAWRLRPEAVAQRWPEAMDDSRAPTV